MIGIVAKTNHGWFWREFSLVCEHGVGSVLGWNHAIGKYLLLYRSALM